MLFSAVRRLSAEGLSRTLRRSALSELKFSHRISGARHFSSTLILKQTDVAAAKVVAAAQTASPTTAQISDTVTEKIVDISATSNVTISQIAEGLSTDLLTADGITPTLQDMGLGCYYTPAGLVQNALDFLHSMGLPWWAAIASATLAMRFMIFPLIVDSQRYTLTFKNVFPEMQRLQLKVSEAKQSGNALEAARALNKLAIFVKENDTNPLKGFKAVAIQMPIFMSFFFGLRGMANLPMESMKTGGMYWFTDLTVPDPYYILPLVTCSTMFIMIKTGADGLMNAGSSKRVKYAMRAFPVVMFPITMSFPAALSLYWTTTNFFALGQMLFLRQPAMRKRFNLPEPIKHEPEAMKTNSKGFIKDMKENFTNMKLSSEVNDRVRADEMRFRRSGTDAVRKTFKHPQPIKPTAES